jgi:PadR family transcriptional regulator, regulatory protein PadR
MRHSDPVDTSQMLRGALDLVVLAVLADDDGYGYDVLRRLRDAGLTEVGDASVYGTLRRLSKAGLLLSYTAPSDEGPDRRYYGLTPAGREELRLGAKTWWAFSSAVDHLIRDHAPGRTP